MARKPNALFKFSVLGEKVFQRTLDKAKTFGVDLTVPFGIVAKDFYKSQETIFSLKGPGGYDDFKGPTIGQLRKGRARTIPTRYDSYTPYQYRKEKLYGYRRGYPLLLRTGRLADSTTDPNSAEAILKITPDRLVIGTSVPYAKYHQSDEPRGKIPLRKFLFIAPESRTASNPALSGRLERWNRTIQTFVLRSMGATFEEATGKSGKR